MKHRNWNAPPLAVFLAVALVALIAVPAFANSAGPPGVQQVTNEQFMAPPDTGQIVIDNVAINPADHLILVNGATTANIESITATANIAVEPINRIASGNIAANSGTVANVNDSSPPGQDAVAQNIVVSPTSAAQTFREAHSDAILHGIAGQNTSLNTAPERAVEFDLLC